MNPFTMTVLAVISILSLFITCSIGFSLQSSSCSILSCRSKAVTFYRSACFTSIRPSRVSLQAVKDQPEQKVEEKSSAFDQVASYGLAGVLAIAIAEAIFWAAGMPLATLWVKITTGEWIDLTSAEGQLQAAGFTFGYGGFATVILQYRVTLFAIPLVPIMEKYVVEPGKKVFGKSFGKKDKGKK
jgi:hypothetical protein